jgi:hypothetical protein
MTTGTHRDDADGHDEEDDSADRQQQRGCPPREKASALALVVGGVHGLDQVGDAAAGADQSDQQADDQSDAEGLIGPRGELESPVLKELRCLARQDLAQAGDLLLDLSGVGDQAVQRHAGDQSGKQCQEGEERNARGQQRDVVLHRLAPRPPQNPLPAGRRDL